MLLHRLQPMLDARQSADQYGFRPTRSIRDAFMVLENMCSKTAEFDVPLRLASPDSRKAFDQIERLPLLPAASEQGVQDYSDCAVERLRLPSAEDAVLISLPRMPPQERAECRRTEGPEPGHVQSRGYSCPRPPSSGTMQSCGCPCWYVCSHLCPCSLKLLLPMVFRRPATITEATATRGAADQWLGVMPRLVSKSLSSRATRYIRCRPSPKLADQHRITLCLTNPFP